jgi:hypothetical protein
VLPLLKLATRRILLTGTPALSRPAELWPQLDALGFGIFPSFKQFGARYCAAWQGPWGMDYTGSSNLAELHTVLHECVMIRRLKANVLTELPDKQRNVIYLDADSQLMEEIKRDMRSQGDWDKIDEHDKKAMMSQLFMQTGRAKIGAVCEYVLQLLTAEPTHKLLVFAHHMEVLDGLQRMLEEHRVSLVRIDGSVDQQQRQVLVDQFQRGHEAQHTRVALLSLTCGSFGFTLTAAQRVVFAELWWTPGQLLQAEDRAHRIGRADATQPVLIDYCLARGTMDDMIWPLIAKKLSVLGTTLNGIRGQLDIEERIDMRSDALLRVWQELGEDPIHDASDEEESGEKKRKKRGKSDKKAKGEPGTKRGKKTTNNNNEDADDGAPKSKKQRRAVEVSSDDVQIVGDNESAVKSNVNTLDKYWKRCAAADPGVEDKPAFVYRDPLALFRTPQPARDTKTTRTALTVAPVSRSATAPRANTVRAVKNEARNTPVNVSLPVVIDLDDSDENVTAATPVKNSFKRKLEFDTAETPRKKQRVERQLVPLVARKDNSADVTRSVEKESKKSGNNDHADVKSALDKHDTSTHNNDEELFGLSDFDLGAQLSAAVPVTHVSTPAPVTPVTKLDAARSSAPVTPFRLFSSPSLSDQTKKRISLSLQKIT